MISAYRGEFYQGSERAFCYDRTLSSVLSMSFECQWLTGSLATWIEQKFPTLHATLQEVDKDQRLESFSHVTDALPSDFKSQISLTFTAQKRKTSERFVRGIGLPVFGNKATQMKRVEYVSALGKRLIELFPDYDFEVDGMVNFIVKEDMLKSPRRLTDSDIRALAESDSEKAIIAAAERDAPALGLSDADVFSNNFTYRETAKYLMFRDGTKSAPERHSINGLGRVDAVLSSFTVMTIMKFKIILLAEKKCSAAVSAVSQEAAGSQSPVVPNSSTKLNELERNFVLKKFNSGEV